MSTARRTAKRVALLPTLTPEQRESRRRLREALRWIARHPNRTLPPPRHERLLRAALAAAVAEIAERDALGLSRARSIECFGVVLLVRITSWGRVILTDQDTGARISSGYGCL
ncbi:MAG: hypothetical protein IPF57_17345 [Gammaproteobacteria bacterium]|jgi:hypothetical protein|nr:hypothetical protein [Gammaproteobacteria bacterium]